MKTEQIFNAPLQKEVLIELKNVNKSYRTRKVLKNINLVINENDRIGVIGPNGAGKSTLSEIISGIRKPTSGKITKRNNLVVGIQFQESKYLVGITVYDLIKYYLEVYKIEMTEKNLKDLLDIYQVSEFKARPIEKLSGGQQQRVNILLSLIHNPDFVIFDEISTGLDIEVRKEIFDFIKKHVVNENKSLMLVTHMMSEIEEICNKYIYVQDGQIIESGNVEDLIAKYGSVHNYTWEMFSKHKAKHQIRTNIPLETNKHGNVKNKVDRIVNKAIDKGKNIPLLKLILKYYLKGIAVPFFIIAFPIMLLFLEGFAFKEVTANNINIIRQLIIACAAVGIANIGISVLPQTILEFRNSVLLKRIGASGTKLSSFIVTILIMNFIFMIFSFSWTLLWGGILFGSEFGWNELLAFNSNGAEILFLLLLMLTSMMFGLALASILGSVSSSAFITISTMIYMPVSFLSGTFIPMSLIENNTILNIISYINIFKYTISPLSDAWLGKIEYDSQFAAYMAVAVLLITAYFIVVFKKFNWEK